MKMPRASSNNNNSHNPAEIQVAKVEHLSEAVPENTSGLLENPGLVEELEVAKRKRPSLPVLGLLLIGLCVGGGLGFRQWQYASTHESTDDAQLQGHIYEVSSRINGTVQQVAVSDNQTVNAGDLLVQLDPQTFQAQVDQAQATLSAAQQAANAAQIGIAQASANTHAQTTSADGALASANAGISSAQAALTTAQAGVPVAQAEIDKANAALDQAKADDSRYEELFKQGAVSAEQRDSYRQAYKTAQAQRAEVQQQLKQAQAQVAEAQSGIDKAQSQLLSSQGTVQQAQATGLQTGVNSSQFAAAEAQIQAAQASLKSAELNLSYTQIQAPEAGTVGNKSVEPGTQVSVGQPLMAVVGNDFWVMANFKETQLAKMKPGEPVEIKVDALGGKVLTGKIDSLSPASGSQFSLLPADNATGNFTKVVQRVPIKILLDPSSLAGEAARLTPGLSATVTVDVSDVN